MKLRAALVAACLLAASASTASPAFDDARAWKDVQALAVTPRRAAIAVRLRQAGFRAREVPFDGGANLIGERPGRTAELVVVAARFDSGDDSGAAVLLELARALSAGELARTLRLVFFDGHAPGLAASEALAARMSGEGELARVRALLTLDRVGDTDLRLETSPLAAPALVVRALAAARLLEPPPVLAGLPRAHFDGDHLPFVRRGLRAVLPLAGRGERPPSREGLGRAGALVLALTRELAVATPPLR